MTDWTRESLLRWIETHAGQEIVLRQQGSALKVHGICRGVEQLDACSTQYQECSLAPFGMDVDMTMSFHTETISLQMIARHPESNEVSLSLPISIPFSELLLTQPDEQEQDAESEPEFYPYELL